MRVLVTGGAGYIGSVTVELLVAAGHSVVVLDSLAQGYRDAVSPDAVLVEGSIADGNLVRHVLNDRGIDAVIHLAGESNVRESVSDPRLHFQANIGAGLDLFDAVVDAGVRPIVFSSSAAVYGVNGPAGIREEDPVEAISPYGESKRMMERVLSWYRRAYGMRYLALRYFNAAGASRRYGEAHRPETHLIPILLDQAWAGTGRVRIFGTDFDTPDGTCIRDYVHVEDIGQGHVRALERVLDLGEGVLNLGTGLGYSVRQILHAAEQVTNRRIPCEEAGRRPGDLPVLVANADRARDVLGWKPERSSLQEMIESAWCWKREHPAGYRS